MKIIFLSPHSDPEARLGEPDAGGQCLYEHQLAKALSDVPGVEVVTYCRLASDRPPTSQVTNHYQVRRIESESNRYIPKERIEKTIRHFARQVAVELEEDQSPLVFHGHYWDGGKASLYLKSKFPKACLVWTPHSLGAVKRRHFEGEWNERIYNFIPRLVWENYTAFAANAIIVSTLDEKLQVSRQYLANPKKISVISPGIDTVLFSPIDRQEARAKLGLAEDDSLLLCLGRIDRSKGYHHAIRALRELLNYKPESRAKLLICGGSVASESAEENAYLKELKELATQLGLAERVIFHPAVPHEEVRFFYGAADIFLMVSESEPFGITVLEAMAMGMPVIAFNSGGPSDIITHNQTGLLIEKHDYERMAYYMDALLSHQRYRERISRHARSFIAADFNWSEKAEEFLEIYQDSLAEVALQPTLFSEWLNNNYFLKHNLSL
jgi:glycosyltransferase involved in cell wall biosynthesis